MSYGWIFCFCNVDWVCELGSETMVWNFSWVRVKGTLGLEIGLGYGLKLGARKFCGKVGW